MNQQSTVRIAAAYHCAQMMYITQQGTVLIIFALNLQTNITALMQSIGTKTIIPECQRWLEAGAQTKHPSQTSELVPGH